MLTWNFEGYFHSSLTFNSIVYRVNFSINLVSVVLVISEPCQTVGQNKSPDHHWGDPVCLNRCLEWYLTTLAMHLILYLVLKRMPLFSLIRLCSKCDLERQQRRFLYHPCTHSAHHLWVVSVCSAMVCRLEGVVLIFNAGLWGVSWVLFQQLRSLSCMPLEFRALGNTLPDLQLPAPIISWVFSLASEAHYAYMLKQAGNV